jgi:hypothetical protein
VLLVLCVLGAAGGSASAMTAAPGWHVFDRVGPTDMPPGGEGMVTLYIFNTGAATSGEAALVDTLPEGLTVSTKHGEELGGTGTCSEVGTHVVTCKIVPLPPNTVANEGASSGSIRGSTFTGIIKIPVEVASSAKGTAVNTVTMEGGGALHRSVSSVPIKFSSVPASLGFENFESWFTNANGTADTQAGSHPYELSVAMGFTTIGERGTEYSEDAADGEPRDLVVNLPPGIVGDPSAIPQCTRREFDGDEGEAAGEHCPEDSLIGFDTAEVYGNRSVSFPVYNLVPPAGIPAQFAFNFNGIATFLDAGVRTGGDNGISTKVDNIAQRELSLNAITIWGDPGEHGTGAAPVSFLQLPTSCGAPGEFTAEMLGSWQDPSARPEVARSLVRTEEGVPSGFTGCERLAHFEPKVSIAPDTSYADTPAGLTVSLRMPQGVDPEELPTAGLKDTTVTLPEGVVINPGQATGLQACLPSQEGRGPEGLGSETDEEPPSCPAASKVGTDEIETPLVKEPLKGNLYVLTSDPPHLQLLLSASGAGVNLKLIGDVELNPLTGRLTGTFNETPDLPFTNFKLAFSGGAQAALVTPTRCGVYGSLAEFVPWSTPFVSTAMDTSSFAVDGGPGGSACQWPLPFAPTMSAGATTDQAGGYTDFTMLLQRGDGQQRIANLQFKTPEGLLGMISTVPLCEEPQAASGQCPAASQIGHTVAEAGPGPYPFTVPQAGAPPAPIYLTGPYGGAPFGLSIVVPVVAGPFNLGTVTVRGRIEVDPHTSQLTITTSELPTILHGIPADLRAIDAVIDRPGFMFNPTSCAPMSFSGTATSTEGATAPLESHFQMGSCRALTFKPNLQVSTSGKPSRSEGESLAVKIVYPTGNLGANQASSQSNIKSVKVELPKQLPSRLTTLQKACPAAVFERNPAGCPPASVVGHATAITPVLPVPLTGPAYFVSHGGEAFPSLIIVLQGYGVTVDVVGTTFISKAGITSSTFKSVPDVPIGSFELVLPKGPFSALAANGNICKAGLTMPTEFVAQNGAELSQATKIAVTGCPKAKKAKAKHRARAKHKTKGKAGTKHKTMGKARQDKPKPKR